MPNPTQATRHIAMATPLGEDELLLRSFSVHEEVSRLFEFELDLLSENYEINFDDIIGKNVTISMELPQGGKRYWNGFINRFVQGVSTSTQFAQYRATMVPWLWFLTRTSDCRIFQEKTVPDIIKQIFSDLGFSDIEDRLSGGYRTWTYCVQYRETDFNFVSRLMEQEGIYYYFFHEQDKCTIVLCDSRSKHDPYGDYNEIEFTPDTQSSAQQERIREWTVEKIVQPGKFAHTDYNFEKPSTSLMSTEEDKKTHDWADLERYDFPGEYPEKSDGDKYAKVRMEELARSHEICSGQSDSRGICPGYLFELAKHTRRDQNREYLILSADYRGSAEDYETSGGQDAICDCSFTAIPSSVQFRPTRTTPKPVIQGTQTAVVTGPSGEEIYTDPHGRVKVQFHWDREGGYDENSSCWIRVSQVHAGKGFGGIDIPRIDEEVIVSFMEGDPDRPLITGRVYNAELMPPFGLPGQKVVSGMKSNSTPGGGGYNEFTLNDTKGTEGIIIHGQHNMDTTVENDESYTIGNNRTTNVGVDDTETIGSNQTIKVGGNQTEEIGSNQTLTVGVNQDISVGAKQKLAVGGSQTQTIGATRSVKVSASDLLSVGASRSVNVGAALKTTASSIKMESSGSTKVISGATISVTAGGSIKLTAGGSAIEIGPGGIKLKTGALVDIKAAMIKHNA
ncbi:MAG: type VI secretion system tip protein TssI/VgrG [Desulfobacterales bacterium]